MHKTIKIGYQHVYDYGIYPFDEEFSLDPYPKIKDYSSEDIFYHCPAWSHKAKRTFIVRSPMDFHFVITPMRTENGPVQVLRSPTMSQELYDKIVALDANWYKNEKAIVQLCVPQINFWTREKDIWMEIRPISETVVKNNLSVIGAWFSISAWNRPASFGFTVIDNNKPIIVKRGDPIFEVCFYSKNLNDEFVLKKQEVPEDIMKNTRRRLMLKYFQRGLSAKFMFGQKEEKESKCPFAFLWKKQDKETR
jgi:hypothetical protein